MNGAARDLGSVSGRMRVSSARRYRREIHLNDLPKREKWYLVISAKGEERAVFRNRIGQAYDFAFEEGAGSLVAQVADRDAIPEHMSEPLYVAEEREYMIRLANGMDYGHFPGETRCCVQADRLGPGTTVTRLGRDLREGPVIYTAK